MIDIRKSSVDSSTAKELLKELSEVLERITGSTGNNSFNLNAMDHPRAAFFIAYLDGEAIGCGAIQEYNYDTAEIKRVYSKKSEMGIGSAIITALEKEALLLGYSNVILETRKVNNTAVNFYLHNGYQICDNYGKYIGLEEAVCFRKHVLRPEDQNL